MTVAAGTPRSDKASCIASRRYRFRARTAVPPRSSRFIPAISSAMPATSSVSASNSRHLICSSSKDTELSAAALAGCFAATRRELYTTRRFAASTILGGHRKFVGSCTTSH